MSETALKPANENPWYVLMTLYGEQTEGPGDNDLHEKNRAAWNAWSGQALTNEGQARASEASGVAEAEFSAWPTMKEAVLQRHKDEMLRRNGEGFGYRSVPNPLEGVNLMKTEFSRPLVFNQMVFFGQTFFDGGTMAEDVSCSQSIFLSGATFTDVTFCKAASFNKARFVADTDFWGASFLGPAWFNRADFTSGAAVIGAKFDQKAWFQCAKFPNFAVFNDATFNGLANFRLAEFGAAGEDKRADFTDCKFENPTDFRQATFHARYPEFAGAILHERTSFTADDKLWPKGAQADPEGAKASCAVIRHNLGKQGLLEEEHFFFRREMELAGQSGPWLQRPLYWLFGWLSDYGNSILTPFLWLFLLIALGAYILTWGLWGGAQALGFWEAFGTSFSNVFNFLGFHRAFLEADFTQKLPQWLKVVSAFQTIFGVVLLFFLGLGWRTRFRLR